MGVYEYIWAFRYESYQFEMPANIMLSTIPHAYFSFSPKNRFFLSAAACLKQGAAFIVVVKSF